MTTEIERIKILEGKISHIIEYVSRILEENEKLKSQIKALKDENKNFQDQMGKALKLDESLKKYQKEREVIKEKIETIISQIDQLGI